MDALERILEGKAEACVAAEDMWKQQAMVSQDLNSFQAAMTVDRHSFVRAALRSACEEVVRDVVDVIEKEADGHIKGSYPQSALLVTAKHLKYRYLSAFSEEG